MPFALGTPEALGYGCNVAPPSNAHVNVMPPGAICISSPTARLCEPIVIDMSPVAGLYVAPVGVNCAVFSLALPSVVCATSVLSAS